MRYGLIASVVCGVACCVPLNCAYPQSQTPKSAPAPAPAPAVKIKRTEIVVAENWTITCMTPDIPNAKRGCTADLKILQSDSATNAQRAVFTWLLGKDGGKPTAVIVVPTGVQIAPGIAFKLGDRHLKTLPFTQCHPDHCEAILTLDEALVKALSTQSTAKFSVTGANSAVAEFSVNLAGFDEAWAAVAK